MKINKVVLVGHCGADSGTLAWAVSKAAGPIPVLQARSAAELSRLATPDALLLINRVLDGGFETRSGVELIGGLARGDNPPATMLISDYPEVQAQAVKAGARAGFGKSRAFEKETAILLRQALGLPEPQISKN